MNELEINISKTIRASIEETFDAWLNPETLARFMLPAPGMPAPATEIDARVGGNFTILMKVGEHEIPHTGKYLELSRPHKLAFTWNSPASPDDSVVTLSFTKTENGNTRVNLQQVKFIDDKTRSDHLGGWTNILSTLDDILTTEAVA